MRRLGSILLMIVGAAMLVGAVGGCAVNRRVLTKGELECRRGAYLERTAEEHRQGVLKIVRRWKREYEDYQSGKSPDPPIFDVLVISGGGDKGSFAAGFLAAWSQVEGPLARPKFDVVTGVSTGALIAPFAFNNDPLADARILKIYEEPKNDWAQFRDWFFFLPGRESFFDPAGLERDISREVNNRLVLGMARGAAEDRILAIGTTNLDLGLSHTWDLSEEAVRALAKGKLNRVQDILRASAAIPAVFPPVVIDDALHVDGGTTSNILLIDDLRSEDGPRRTLQRLYPEIPVPKMRFWIIINNRIDPEPKIIQPTWVSITTASVDALIRSSTMTTLRLFAEQVDYVNLTEHLGIELRYVSIPDDWTPAKVGLFQEQNMRELAERGIRAGLNPASWKTGLARSLPTQYETPPACPPDAPKEQN